MKRKIAVLCCCVVLLSGLPVQAEELGENHPDEEQYTYDNIILEDQNDLHQDEINFEDVETTEDYSEEKKEDLDASDDVSIEKDESAIANDVIIPEKPITQIKNQDSEKVQENSNTLSEEAKEGFISKDGKTYYYENGESALFIQRGE